MAAEAVAVHATLAVKKAIFLAIAQAVAAMMETTVSATLAAKVDTSHVIVLREVAVEVATTLVTGFSHVKIYQCFLT